ncbi:hypothetical protein [Salibacterium aidingense]|uniref:hypothetical protein n=1 Tax=Salibacterium aidingense TaxID=384933 RepID=UPI003BCE03DE
MNNPKKLNKLVSVYKLSGKDKDFDIVFQHLESMMERSISLNSRKYLLSEEETRAIYHDVLYYCTENWKEDVGNFIGYFTRTVNYRLIDHARKKEKLREREIIPKRIETEGKEDDTDFFEVQNSGINLEDEAIKMEQRQLLRHLYANTDEFARSVIEKFLELGNVGATAKSLNSNDNRVNSALARLGRQYDANQFGDHRDYVTVALR